MIYRRKKWKIEDYIYGIKREADIDYGLEIQGIEHIWHNKETYEEVMKILEAGGKIIKIKESFKDVDFDAWWDGIYSEICSESIKPKRAREIHDYSKIRFRVSLIKEQSIKNHMVYYWQPWPDGCFCFNMTMKDLQCFLDTDMRLRQEWGIFERTFTIEGRKELFIEFPLSYVGFYELKEGSENAYYQSLCKSRRD